MIDEVTVAVGSAGMVVFSAGLANADGKRVARERWLVIEAMVLVASVVKVGSSGNVARLSCLKSVAQASSILLASEGGMGRFLRFWRASMLRSKASARVAAA
jgi:hypothetical protein